MNKNQPQDIKEVKCPVCKRTWDINTEQALAIEKRGKDIGCLIEAGDSLRDDNGKYAFYRKI